MIALRRATDADRVAIARLHEASIRALGPRAYTAEEVDSWAAGVSPSNYDLSEQFYVAVDDVRIAGFGQYHNGEIRAVYIDPDYVRQGVGRMMIEKLEEVARAEGARHLYLRASLNAVGFYAACGYARTMETVHPTRGGLAIKCALMEKDV